MKASTTFYKTCFVEIFCCVCELLQDACVFLASNAMLFIKLGLYRNMLFGCARYSNVVFASYATFFFFFSKTLSLWNIVFLASNATAGESRVLVKYCIKVWCEVDCQLTTFWQILEIKQLPKLLLLLSFLQMSFFQDFFIDWLWQSSSSAQIRV